MDKFAQVAIVLALAVVAVSSAPAPQLYYSQPAIASQSSNILRTPGNLGQISTYTKAIDTPTSSVRKSDIRISNDALAYPAVTAYHAPAAVAYHAPAAVATYHAPAAAVATYHAPAAAVATPVASHSLLGVAYSPAASVSHVTFDGFGAHYVL
nr:PREDICTED: cuticle protein 67-like [Bemisia tabaci]